MNRGSLAETERARHLRTRHESVKRDVSNGSRIAPRVVSATGGIFRQGIPCDFATACPVEIRHEGWFPLTSREFHPLGEGHGCETGRPRGRIPLARQAKGCFRIQSGPARRWRRPAIQSQSSPNRARLALRSSSSASSGSQPPSSNKSGNRSRSSESGSSNACRNSA